MIIRTAKTFLKNMKPGDTFWFIDDINTWLQEPVALKIVCIFDRQDKETKKVIWYVKTNSNRFAHQFLVLERMHQDRKVTTTTEKEARDYFDEQKLLEEVDPVLKRGYYPREEMVVAVA